MQGTDEMEQDTRQSLAPRQSVSAGGMENE